MWGKADNEQVITKTKSAPREEESDELFRMIMGISPDLRDWGSDFYADNGTESVGVSLRKELAIGERRSTTEEIAREGSAWGKSKL